MHLPITTNSISSPMGLGSDSLPVKVELHGIDTYLSDSMQFLLEYGCRLFDKGVYYIMPSFRGEAVDERHLSQFYHIEAEAKMTIDEVIELIESYLRYLCRHLLLEYNDELFKITGDNKHIEKMANLNRFPQISFDEAVALLRKNEEYVKVHEEGFRTITNNGERQLVKEFGGIVWIRNFDYLSVPFYQARHGKSQVKNADLLFGIGEVVGAGERHINGLEVTESLLKHNHDPATYQWYINLKNEYPIRTSGFGMGVERFILWLTNHDDIRDCQLIPRINGLLQIP